MLHEYVIENPNVQAMANCYYHPDARGSATCPDCRMNICDKCRLNGNGTRCMSCQSEINKGGKEDTRAKRTMCTNHEGVPTDTNCKQCRKPHCAACLNGASLCFRCGMAGPRPQTEQASRPRAPRRSRPPRAAWPRCCPKVLGGGLAAIVVVGLVGYALANRKGGGGDEDSPFMGKSGLQLRPRPPAARSRARR